MKILKQLVMGSCFAVGTAATLGLAGTGFAADVMFIDGGYAELCSSAATKVDDVNWIELTGSRLAISSVEICTHAIEESGGYLEDLASSYNNRGVLLFAEEKFTEALADFDRAVEVQAELAAAHVNRGYTLVALQRWADSIPAFDTGIALGAPEPARAHYNRGVAHEELGHVREAYQDYRTASELDPVWEEPRRELTRFTVR